VTIENANFQFQFKANRGDSIYSRNECLRQNVLIAAKQPWCLSSPQQASQSTAKHASQNTCLHNQEALLRASVLTQDKHGHGEEITGKEEKR
jgi:hypothetical protein